MLSKLLKSNYLKNITTLMIGTTFVQVVPILISPLLTRLYSPDSFGQVALIMSVSSILTVFATCRYEMAIILPKETKDALSLVVLIFILSLVFTMVLTIAIFIFNNQICQILKNDKIGNWLYFIPIIVLVTSIYKGFYFFSNRESRYKNISYSRIAQIFSQSAFKIGTGFLSFKVAGLLGGNLIGQITSSFLLGSKILKNEKIYIRSIQKQDIINQAVKYKQFPKYLLVSHSIGTLNLEIPIIFISKFFSSIIVGYYSLSKRIVSLPIQFIARAVGDVFRQKASDEYRKYGKFDKIFIKTILTLFLISIIPFIIFYLYCPLLFSIIFGENWKIAGEYAQILSVTAFIGFISTPVDKGAIIVGNTKYIFVWHMLKFILNLIAILFYVLLNISLKQYLWILVLINCSLYVIDLIIEYRFSLGNKSVFQKVVT
jgi:O-antigen/teichoic acid export membrane protein